MSVIIKTPEEIEIMAESGAILSKGLAVVLAAVKPGVTTNELDMLFVNTIRALGAEPCFLDFHGYPKSICTSINTQVNHAIPSDYVLQEGDIAGIDAGVVYKGYCSDMARTVPVGAISIEAAALIQTTKECIKLGIKQAVVGNTVGDIGAAIQTHAEAQGYGVVRVLVGHGIGKEMHEEPSIPNFGKAGSGMKLREGMVICIEPIINAGGPDVIFEQDGWTVSTEDGSLSAHFEDTLAITAKGPRLLTQL